VIDRFFPCHFCCRAGCAGCAGLIEEARAKFMGGSVIGSD